MLAAEAALFLLIFGVFRSARSAPQLRQGVLRAVITGRTEARTVASSAAIAQVEATGLRVVGSLSGATEYEIARATAAADGAAATWEGHLADAIAEGMPEAEAVKAATARSGWKASQIATTEVAETWSHETGRVAAAVARQGIPLWKVWDAVLDRRTCPVCGGSHGMAVPAGTDFPQGEPGAVHPNCRCQAILVTREQVDPVVAEKGGEPGDAIAVETPPKSTRRPRTPPKPETQAPAAETQQGGLRVIRGGLAGIPDDGEEWPTIEVRQIRKRRIDAIPLPGTPAAAKRTKPATFPKSRPPFKAEVTARKRAQRIAALGVRP